MQAGRTLTLLSRRPHPSLQANSTIAAAGTYCVCNGEVLAPLERRIYRTINRTGSTVYLRCRNGSLDINVELNRNMEFFVNDSLGHRFFSTANLSAILENMGGRLERAGEAAYFQITPDLEGYYSCGTSTTNRSPPRILITLRRFGLPTNSRTEYAVQSRDGSVTLLCPHEPGRLQGCYYGHWIKESMSIVTVAKPGSNCVPPPRSITTDSNKYQLDKETFSLTITSVEAQADSGNYSCELLVLDPAPPNGNTVPVFNRSAIVISLIIDGEPSIMSGPEDVVIGAQNSTSLTSNAEFTCTAIGRPAPEIQWSYLTISRTGILSYEEIRLTLGGPKVLSIDSPENSTEESGRTVVTSRLTLSISKYDGGVIRCRLADSMVYKDARLTVLGKPNIIPTITARGGPIIIDIMLPVHIQYPVRLQISYSNKTHSLDRRAFQPIEPHNDTSIITLREGREKLPEECSAVCLVNVSLIATVGLQRVQGLSSDKVAIDDDANVCSTIEMEEIATRQELMACMQGSSNCEQQKTTNEIIAITVGAAFGVVVLITIVTVLVAFCLYRHSVNQKRESNDIELRDNLTKKNEDLSKKNENLSKENENLSKVNNGLTKQTKDLTEECKDLKQKIKNQSVCHEASTIVTIVEENKSHYSNNPDIQNLLEKFVERAKKVIEIVSTETMDDRVRFDGEDERIQKIKTVMETVNGQLDKIL